VASYAEWLRVAAMSSGLYVLEAGANDPQVPHREDEVYVALAGSAQFTGGGETVAVGPGSVIFVPALEEHRFHDITARLEVVVVFAPAETETPATQPD
jgi:mannose-6-phosphate isomerase-like protein (cupin superfamily)